MRRWRHHARSRVAVAVIVAAVALAIATPILGQVKGTADAAAVRPELKYDPSPDPLPTSPPVVAVIGDSVAAGTGSQVAGDARWSSLLDFRDGWNFANRSVPGAGYVSRGDVKGTEIKRSFEDQVALIPTASSVVLIFGSKDDGAADPGQLNAAAARVYAAVKERAPRARLIVVGPVWTGATVPPELDADRAALRAAATSAGARWIDPIAEKWLPRDGAYYSTDGVSLTVLGQRRIADRLQGPIRDALRLAS